MGFIFISSPPGIYRSHVFFVVYSQIFCLGEEFNPVHNADFLFPEGGPQVKYIAWMLQ